jgi:hypothetical protein
MPVKVRVTARVGNHTFGTTVNLSPTNGPPPSPANGTSSARRSFSFEL